MLTLAHRNAEHVTRETISREQLPTLTDLATRPVVEGGRMGRFGRFAGYWFC
jgi:hypothetical protein